MQDGLDGCQTRATQYGSSPLFVVRVKVRVRVRVRVRVKVCKAVGDRSGCLNSI